MSSVKTADSTRAARSERGASIEGIDHVEMYVSNNHQAAHFYRTALGFEHVGTLDPGRGDRLSIALRQGRVQLLLTSPLSASSEVAEHIRLHGEGIRDIALAARGVEEIYTRAVDGGAQPIMEPTTERASIGELRMARIGACGDLVHTLVERTDANWPAPATLLASPPRRGGPETAIEAIDHVALALGAGELDRWVDFYVSALGFEESHREAVSTEYSAMRSKVVQSTNGGVRFPMMEPAAGKRKSQIDDYLEFHQGPGAQHLAFRTRDIVKSVSAFAAELDLLSTPATYYDSLAARVGDLSTELEAFRRYGILADRDANGVLLQVFTKPIAIRPTLFLELIERRGATGFGSGNIRALFEAVERAQAARGAL